MTEITIDKAVLEQTLDALESVEALIEYQYTGTRDGMSYLQNTTDDAQEALITLRTAIEQAAHGPCDGGEICLGCSPRNPDGSCPDAPRTPQECVAASAAIERNAIEQAEVFQPLATVWRWVAIKDGKAIYQYSDKGYPHLFRHSAVQLPTEVDTAKPLTDEQDLFEQHIRACTVHHEAALRKDEHGRYSMWMTKLRWATWQEARRTK